MLAGAEDHPRLKTKERNDDRILVLKPIEGKNVLATSGLIDNRLFAGGNSLHGIKEESTGLWFLKYDVGGVPPALRDQKFTSFSALMKYAGRYFNSRGVEIVEVID